MAIPMELPPRHSLQSQPRPIRPGTRETRRRFSRKVVSTPRWNISPAELLQTERIVAEVDANLASEIGEIRRLAMEEEELDQSRSVSHRVAFSSQTVGRVLAALARFAVERRMP